jgi:hypothetical protein
MSRKILFFLRRRLSFCHVIGYDELILLYPILYMIQEVL